MGVGDGGGVGVSDGENGRFVGNGVNVLGVGDGKGVAVFGLPIATGVYVNVIRSGVATVVLKVSGRLQAVINSPRKPKSKKRCWRVNKIVMQLNYSECSNLRHEYLVILIVYLMQINWTKIENGE